MGRIIGVVAWIAGMVVFYLSYLNSILQHFEVAQDDTARGTLMLVFAGVWALAVNLALYLLPTSVQAKLK